jgi:Holliday junction resolvase RusA-like endonuclease
MKFKIDGKIKGKARARHFNGVAVTPQDTVNYENYIKILYKMSKGLYYQKPIKMIITAYFEMPVSKIKTDKARLKFLQENPRPTKKPDADNIAKIVADSLNKIAYHDDSQIVEMTILKNWSEHDEYLEVEITEA